MNKTACFGQFLCPSSGVFHCTHSSRICHTVLLTACEQDQYGTQFCLDPVRKLSTDLSDIYHCCVYSEKLLMMVRGTVQNVEFYSKNKFEKLVHLVGFIIRRFLSSLNRSDQLQAMQPSGEVKWPVLLLITQLCGAVVKNE